MPTDDGRCDSLSARFDAAAIVRCDPHATPWLLPRETLELDATAAVIWCGSGSIRELWTAGSNRCASRMRGASEAIRNVSPSPSKLKARLAWMMVLQNGY